MDMDSVELATKNICDGEAQQQFSSQSHLAETYELEDIITEQFHRNGRLYGSSLTALFRLSGVMSHVIVTAVSSGSAIQGFMGNTT
jgi:hypothetical protein